MASYKIEIVKSAQKEIRKLPQDIRTRIIASIHVLANNPRPMGYQKLRGSKTNYRIRCGDYRVVYGIFDATITIVVVKVAHRREVYR